MPASNSIVIKASEPQAVRGERIDVGSINLTAVTGEIGPPHIIDHNQHNVGTFFGLDRSAKHHFD